MDLSLYAALTNEHIELQRERRVAANVQNIEHWRLFVFEYIRAPLFSISSPYPFFRKNDAGEIVACLFVHVVRSDIQLSRDQGRHFASNMLV